MTSARLAGVHSPSARVPSVVPGSRTRRRAAGYSHAAIGPSLPGAPRWRFNCSFFWMASVTRRLYVAVQASRGSLTLTLATARLARTKTLSAPVAVALNWNPAAERDPNTRDDRHNHRRSSETKVPTHDPLPRFGSPSVCSVCRRMHANLTRPQRCTRSARRDQGHELDFGNAEAEDRVSTTQLGEGVMGHGLALVAIVGGRGQPNMAAGCGRQAPGVLLGQPAFSDAPHQSEECRCPPGFAMTMVALPSRSGATTRSKLSSTRSVVMPLRRFPDLDQDVSQGSATALPLGDRVHDAGDPQSARSIVRSMTADVFPSLSEVNVANACA